MKEIEKRLNNPKNRKQSKKWMYKIRRSPKLKLKDKTNSLSKRSLENINQFRVTGKILISIEDILE